MCTEPSHPSLANSHSSGKLLLLFFGFVFCVLFLTMDFVWMRDFLEGMLKPLAATMVVVMAVLLSYLQKLGLEREMIYSIARAFLQLSVIGFVLQFIFSQENSLWIILAYLFMVRLSPPHVFHSYKLCLVFEKIWGTGIETCSKNRTLWLLCFHKNRKKKILEKNIWLSIDILWNIWLSIVFLHFYFPSLWKRTDSVWLMLSLAVILGVIF